MRVLFIFILLSLFAMNVYASNYHFLQASAITFFNDQDKDMMEANMIKALNQFPDGKKIMWKNPQSGNWGYVIPSRTTYKRGMRCRQLKIYNNGRGVEGEAQYQFCKMDNRWRIVS